MARIRFRTRILWLLAVVNAVILVVAGGFLAFDRDGGLRVTAYFTTAVGVYSGSDVRVLGVAVGTVDAVEPDGQRIRVRMTLDRDVPVPAGASALVVTPAIVSDRYVQLAPAYRDGPRLADDAEIPVARTGVPVELDELAASVNRMTTALGPEGANANGALSRLLHRGGEIWEGNGAKLGESLRELAKAAKTLGGSDQDLFQAVDSLQKFTGMLVANDRGVGQLDQQLAQLATFLAGERDQFGAALRELGGALGQLQGFIRDNRGRVKSNVDKLAGITKVLADQRASLAEMLDTAPLALANVLDAYDPATRTLDMRTNLTEFTRGDPVAANAGPPLPLPSVSGGAR